ncbi:MAG: hypothetical protein GY821_04855 [Gammaproteobacteria bacterium]|nr:hypothetical protein [Gammaproteobacteria bacterium]
MIIEFVKNNYQWIFSGIGGSAIFWIIGYKQGYRKSINQNMYVGNTSTSIQVGGNIHNDKEK